MTKTFLRESNLQVIRDIRPLESNLTLSGETLQKAVVNVGDSELFSPSIQAHLSLVNPNVSDSSSPVETWTDNITYELLNPQNLQAVSFQVFGITTNQLNMSHVRSGDQTSTTYTAALSLPVGEYLLSVRTISHANTGESLQDQKNLKLWVRQVPNLLSNTPIDKGLELEWAKVSGADHYSIEYSLLDGSLKKLTAPTFSSKIQLTGLFSLPHRVKVIAQYTRVPAWLDYEVDFYEPRAIATPLNALPSSVESVAILTEPGKGLKITWIPVAGAGDYSLRWSLDPEAFNKGSTSSEIRTTSNEVILSTTRIQSHFFNLMPCNRAGCLSNAVIYHGLPQTGKPPTPTLQVAGLVSNAKPDWFWSSNGGSGHFRFALNDSDLESAGIAGRSDSYKPSTNLPEGYHSLYLQERDDSSTWSDVVSATTLIDLTPPSKPLVQGLEITKSRRPTWSWSGSSGGVGSFRYKLDNPDLTTNALGGSNASYTPAQDLIDGLHIFYVQERDEAGNWSSSGSFATLIDTVAPPRTRCAWTGYHQQ